MEQPVEDLEQPRRLPRATLAATIVLAVCSIASFAFVVQNGGIAIPELAEAAPTFAPVVTTPPVPSASAAAVVDATLAPTPSASPTPVPTATPVPTPSPTATPAPTTSPAPTPSRTPASTAPSSRTPAPTTTPAPTPAPTTRPTATPAPTASPTPAPTATPATTTAATPRATPSPTIDTGSATQSRLRLLTPCRNRSDCWIYVIRSGDNLSSIASFFGVSLARIYALNPELQGSLLRPGRQVLIPTPTR